MSNRHDTPKPPDGLSAPTAAWWKAVVATFDLEPHHVELLRLACEALDTWRTAYEAVRKHGLTYIDRFGAPRQRPEVNIVRDSRIAFSRLVRELSLDTDDAPEPPRPPRISNRYTGN